MHLPEEHLAKERDWAENHILWWATEADVEFLSDEEAGALATWYADNWIDYLVTCQDTIHSANLSMLETFRKLNDPLMGDPIGSPEEKNDDDNGSNSGS